jgi:hypothetical protein
MLSGVFHNKCHTILYHTDSDCELIRLPDLEKGLTAAVTGRQGILIPDTLFHLWYIQGSVLTQFPDLYFL